MLLCACIFWSYDDHALQTLHLRIKDASFALSKEDLTDPVRGSSTPECICVENFPSTSARRSWGGSPHSTQEPPPHLRVGAIAWTCVWFWTVLSLTLRASLTINSCAPHAHTRPIRRSDPKGHRHDIFGGMVDIFQGQHRQLPSLSLQSQS